MPLKEIAQVIGIGVASIKRGLRDKELDFGYALRIGNGDQYRYLCPDKQVWEKLGYFNPDAQTDDTGESEEQPDG